MEITSRVVSPETTPPFVNPNHGTKKFCPLGHEVQRIGISSMIINNLRDDDYRFEISNYVATPCL
jgi:hypothetical protein